jgi:hypothetical protein
MTLTAATNRATGPLFERPNSCGNIAILNALATCPPLAHNGYGSL